MCEGNCVVCKPKWIKEEGGHIITLDEKEGRKEGRKEGKKGERENITSDE